MFRIKMASAASLGCLLAMLTMAGSVVQAADYSPVVRPSRAYFIASPMIGPPEYYPYPWRAPMYGEVEPYAYGSYDPYGPYVPPETPYGYVPAFPR